MDQESDTPTHDGEHAPVGAVYARCENIQAHQEAVDDDVCSEMVVKIFSMPLEPSPFAFFDFKGGFFLFQHRVQGTRGYA